MRRGARRRDAMRCDAMRFRCDGMRCDCDAIRYDWDKVCSRSKSAMRCDAMRCDAMRRDATWCETTRCDAMRCDFDAMRCDAMAMRLRCDAMPGWAKMEPGWTKMEPGWANHFIKTQIIFLYIVFPIFFVNVGSILEPKWSQCGRKWDVGWARLVWKNKHGIEPSSLRTGLDPMLLWGGTLPCRCTAWGVVRLGCDCDAIRLGCDAMRCKGT